MGGITETQSAIVSHVSIACTVLSIIGALFVIGVFALYFYLGPLICSSAQRQKQQQQSDDINNNNNNIARTKARWQQKRKRRSPSRLILYTSMSDLLYAIFNTMEMTSSINTPPPFCRFIMVGWVYSILASIFFTTCMAVNLLIVILIGKKTSHKHEIAYIVASISAAAIFGLLPLTNEAYGYNESYQLCWYSDGGSLKNILWQTGVFFVPVGVSVVFCTIIFIAVAIKILHTTWKASKHLQKHHHHRTTTNGCGGGGGGGGGGGSINDDSDPTSIAKAVARRLMLYPVVMIITQSLNFLNEFYTYGTRGEGNFVILLINIITIDIYGFVNAVIFAFDPALRPMWRTLCFCCFRRNRQRPGTQGNINNNDQDQYQEKQLDKQQQHRESGAAQLPTTTTEIAMQAVVVDFDSSPPQPPTAPHNPKDA
eukprot:GEZU01029184.1.p1 GENE.GEZU01029184.1~~GEZU01029184.1.p1  ORF type:complete len:426 (-),score=108.86 GEZU01029184.1:85-1362(-)